MPVNYTTNPASVDNTALGAFDLSLTTDLTPDFQVVSGRTALAQALVRRWSTPRGRLIDDPNYGTSLTDALNEEMSPGDIARLQAASEAEALSDERVSAISSTSTFVNGALNIDFTVTDAAGPFSLTIAVTSLTIDLLKVSS